jgi:hypothetical protein
MPEFFLDGSMSVAPHANTQVTRIAPVFFQTLPRCIAKPPACQCGEESRLAWCLGPGVDMHMTDVLVFWIVAVCTGSGDIDFGRWFGFASTLGRFEYYGKALTGRRRNALRGRLLVVDGVVARMLGAKKTHDGNGIGGNVRDWSA